MLRSSSPAILPRRPPACAGRTVRCLKPTVNEGRIIVLIWLLVVGSSSLALTRSSRERFKLALAKEKLRLILKFKPVIKKIYKKYDYNEYGGAPLLGVNGTALICHGASKSKTIKNAVLASKRYYTEKVNEKITEYLSKSPLLESSQNGKSEDALAETS